MRKVFLPVFLPPFALGVNAEDKSMAERSAIRRISLSLDYTLASDYVWRGINLSEYRGEGREKLNHQVGVGVSLDTKAGRLGASVWSEWYMGQERLVEEAHNKLQEIDYTLWWSYSFQSVFTTLEIGWTALTFPHQKGDAFSTYEVFSKLSLDDSFIFGFPLVNPFVFCALDFDLGKGGSWINIGGSHDFALKDLALVRSVPFVKDLTLTPYASLGIDLRYLHNFSVAGRERPIKRLANVGFGLSVSFDLNSA